MTDEGAADVPPKVTLHLDINGEAHAIEIAPPSWKNVVRLAVGDPTQASAPWRIFGGPNENDVYIAVRSTAGTWKWSLHLKTGSWMLQITKEAAQKYGIAQRILGQWPRPPEIGGSGWTPAFTIFVRRRDLAPIPAAARKHYKGVDWLRTPDEGRMAVVSVFIARPDLAEVQFRGHIPLHAFQLPNGHVVFILLAYPELSTAIDEQIEAQKARKLSALASGANLPAFEHPRMVLDTAEGDGPPQVWDVLVETI